MRYYHGIQLGFVPDRSHRLSKHERKVKLCYASLVKNTKIKVASNTTAGYVIFILNVISEVMMS